MFPECLYYILETDEFFDYVMAGSNGAKMPRGDKGWIMKYPVVIAKDKVFVEFNKTLIPSIKLKVIKRNENIHLNQLSKILLSKIATF